MNGVQGNGCGRRQAAFEGGHGGTWVLALLGLIAGACQTTHRSDNSNTSWLACDSARDCELHGSNFECRESRCVVRVQPPLSDGGMAGQGTAGRGNATAGSMAQIDASVPAPGDAGVAGATAPVPDAGDPCPDGEIVDSVSGCLLDSAFCRELPDGRYCTGSVPLTCPFPMVPIGEDEPCPDGVICHEGSETRLRCQELPLMDEDTCVENGNGWRVLSGTNAKTLLAAGCPRQQVEIGWYDFSSVSLPQAYGLCCALTVEACAPQAAHFTGDCEPANRYYWTGTTCVARTGCECTGPDCDDGAPSAELCEMWFAGCAEITERCGGFSGQTCSEDEYCAYIQECGLADGPAICVARPDGCPEDEDPVCGCDGQSYANLCLANMAGTGMLHFGACN